MPLSASASRPMPPVSALAPDASRLPSTASASSRLPDRPCLRHPFSASTAPNGSSSAGEYDYELFTISAGSGGVRASRFTSTLYGARSLPSLFNLIAAMDLGSSRLCLLCSILLAGELNTLDAETMEMRGAAVAQETNDIFLVAANDIFLVAGTCGQHCSFMQQLASRQARRFTGHLRHLALHDSKTCRPCTHLAYTSCTTMTHT